MKSFEYITQVLDRAVEDAQPIEVKGRVIQVVGTIIKASVPGVKVGEVCILRNPWEDFEIQAEVVGFTKDAARAATSGVGSGQRRRTMSQSTSACRSFAVARTRHGVWAAPS